jgi:monoterpene epsilon-lactone hydrolase
MAIQQHVLSLADAAAMKTLRGRLAEHPVAMTRASFDALIAQVPPAAGVEYSEARVGDVPGIWCVPAKAQTTPAMLYLHGGVFVYGSAHAFRRFVGHIVARSGVAAFVADYRLAPEHPFPAALDDAKAAHRGLVERFGASRVAVVGDSAGGNLALELLRDSPSAACGVLLSPMTDLALTGESVTSKAADDPLMTRAALAAGIEQYLGALDREDPRASPLFASLRETPPIQVHVGTAEILLDDSLRLGASDRFDVHAWEGMPHVFPRSVGLFEAARRAHDLIATFLQEHLAN